MRKMNRRRYSAALRGDCWKIQPQKLGLKLVVAQKWRGRDIENIYIKGSKYILS